MKITTDEYDTTLRWEEGDRLFLHDFRGGPRDSFQHFRWSNSERGGDRDGIVVPNARVTRAPSTDDPSLEISIDESTMASLVARAKRHDEIENLMKGPWYRQPWSSGPGSGSPG